LSEFADCRDGGLTGSGRQQAHQPAPEYARERRARQHLRGV